MSITDDFAAEAVSAAASRSAEPAGPTAAATTSMVEAVRGANTTALVRKVKLLATTVDPLVVDSMTREDALRMFRMGVQAEVGNTVATEAFLDAALAQFLQGLVLGRFDLSQDLSLARSLKNNTLMGVPITYARVFPPGAADSKRQWGRALAPEILALYEAWLPENTTIRVPSVIPDYLLTPAMMKKKAEEMPQTRAKSRRTPKLEPDYPGTSETGFYQA